MGDIVIDRDLKLRGGWFLWPLRKRWYRTLKLYWQSGSTARELEVTISPTGRSCRVYLDGEQLTRD
jgi:hypothetical protein